MDRIVHSSAIDIGGGRRGFRSKDTVGGVPGTVVTATHMNATQEEMVAIIEKAGLAPDPGDLTQLVKAIRSQRLNYVAAAQVAGTANAVTLAFTPEFGALSELVGVPIVHIAEADNTGAMTVKVDSLAPVARTWPDGTALVAGDVKAGRMYVERFDGTAFRLDGSKSPAEVVAIMKKTALFGLTATWSQSLSNTLQTYITSFTVVNSNLGDATFSSGTLTVGPLTEGLWISSFSAVSPNAGTEIVALTLDANPGGTAIGFGTSQTSSGAPGASAVAFAQRTNGQKFAHQARQISGGSLTITGRLSMFRLSA